MGSRTQNKRILIQKKKKKPIGTSRIPNALLGSILGRLDKILLLITCQLESDFQIYQKEQCAQPQHPELDPELQLQPRRRKASPGNGNHRRTPTSRVYGIVEFTAFEVSREAKVVSSGCEFGEGAFDAGDDVPVEHGLRAAAAAAVLLVELFGEVCGEEHVVV